MEKLLWLYAQPYDVNFPVLCFDERPCFLIGDTVAPSNASPGKIARQDYHYEKLGSCCLLMAVEPLTGQRWAKVYPTRKAVDYADFMNFLAGQYPEAKKIRLVQDNLNTHCYGSFYKAFAAEKAFELSEKFQYFFTPKKASWLNMAEIEFSALSKQCLNRRIPSMDQLADEVEHIVKERNDKRIKINWQFSIQNARQIFKKAYSKIKLQ